MEILIIKLICHFNVDTKIIGSDKGFQILHMWDCTYVEGKSNLLFLHGTLIEMFKISEQLKEDLML